MKRLMLTLIGLSACLSVQAELPKSIEHSQGTFKLCDKERVSKYFFDIVDVGIYYPNCDTAEHVFDDQTKLLRFSYLREVEGEQFTEGAIEYLEENLSEEEKSRCSEHFAPLNKVYRDVTSGDNYDLFLFQEEGLKLYLNGQALHQMDNPQCHSTYLNVWFGKESMDGQFNDLAERIKR